MSILRRPLVGYGLIKLTPLRIWVDGVARQGGFIVVRSQRITIACMCRPNNFYDFHVMRHPVAWLRTVTLHHDTREITFDYCITLGTTRESYRQRGYVKIALSYNDYDTFRAGYERLEPYRL